MSWTSSMTRSKVSVQVCASSSRKPRSLFVSHHRKGGPSKQIPRNHRPSEPSIADTLACRPRCEGLSELSITPYAGSSKEVGLPPLPYPTRRRVVLRASRPAATSNACPSRVTPWRGRPSHSAHRRLSAVHLAVSYRSSSFFSHPDGQGVLREKGSRSTTGCVRAKWLIFRWLCHNGCLVLVSTGQPARRVSRQNPWSQPVLPFRRNRFSVENQLHVAIAPFRL